MKMLYSFSVFLFIISMAACNSGSGKVDPSSDASRTVDPSDLGCRVLNDGLDALTGNLKIPDHLTGDSPYHLEGDFDPNDYFTVFDHLKMKTGYMLDYVYFFDGMGGFPLIYSRNVNAAQVKSVAELGSVSTPVPGNNSQSAGEYHPDYLNDIELDGSPESYFQYVVFSRAADQFYLFWHSRYRDQILICDGNDIALIEKGMSSFNIRLPQEIKGQILNSDLSPTVEMVGQEVKVRWVEFSKWGGLSEKRITFSRSDPVAEISSQENILVEYECGILY